MHVSLARYGASGLSSTTTIKLQLLHNLARTSRYCGGIRILVAAITVLYHDHALWQCTQIIAQCMSIVHSTNCRLVFVTLHL